MNWFMNHSFGILSSGVKFALHLVHFTTNFELQLQEAYKCSVVFDFSLLEWRVVKNRAGNFWLRFYFLRYWPTLHFCFLWKRYQKYINLHNIKTTHFLRNHSNGFAQQLFPHTPKRILSEDLYFFIGTVTLIHLQD